MVKEYRVSSVRRSFASLCHGLVPLTVGLFLWPPAGLAQKAAGPRMVIEQNSFEAGEFMQGEVIEHTFTVHNTGDDVLEVRKVRPG
jgi:hypothetical protein